MSEYKMFLLVVGFNGELYSKRLTNLKNTKRITIYRNNSFFTNKKCLQFK